MIMDMEEPVEVVVEMLIRRDGQRTDKIWRRGRCSLLFEVCTQGCICCAILPSGMGAHVVSSEHVEKKEMFSCSPT